MFFKIFYCVLLLTVHTYASAGEIVRINHTQEHITYTKYLTPDELVSQSVTQLRPGEYEGHNWDGKKHTYVSISSKDAGKRYVKFKAEHEASKTPRIYNPQIGEDNAANSIDDHPIAFLSIVAFSSILVVAMVNVAYSYWNFN